MSDELIYTPERQVHPLALTPVFDLDEAVERYQDMVKFVGKILRKDSDYGVIPGTGSKPVLLKPGAEKLCTFFGLSKRFEMADIIEDWDGAEHDGEPFFYYRYSCGLYRGDLLVAEAEGSCNSRETKYRWREATRTCPSCGLAKIIPGKAEYGGGWLCFKKTGGCGAKFAFQDERITSQATGRVPNPDLADQVNTMQKMAAKRAFIAATLLAVNASEFFTQDLEDFSALAPAPPEPTPPLDLSAVPIGQGTGSDTPGIHPDPRIREAGPPTPVQYTPSHIEEPPPATRWPPKPEHWKDSVALAQTEADLDFLTRWAWAVEDNPHRRDNTLKLIKERRGAISRALENQVDPEPMSDPHEPAGRAGEPENGSDNRWVHPISGEIHPEPAHPGLEGWEKRLWEATEREAAEALWEEAKVALQAYPAQWRWLYGELNKKLKTFPAPKAPRKKPAPKKPVEGTWS